MRTVEKDAYAYLTITSDTQSLNDITTFLGMPPDGSSWSIGDTRKVANTLRPKYEFSRWSLNSGVSKGECLEAHFVALCLRMSPLSGKLYELPKQMKGSISITGWVEDYADQLCFSAGTLREIGGFGLPLDFDLYSENE
jgi:hypothetical protein